MQLYILAYLLCYIHINLLYQIQQSQKWFPFPQLSCSCLNQFGYAMILQFLPCQQGFLLLMLCCKDVFNQYSIILVGEAQVSLVKFSKAFICNQAKLSCQLDRPRTSTSAQALHRHKTTLSNLEAFSQSYNFKIFIPLHLWKLVRSDLAHQFASKSFFLVLQLGYKIFILLHLWKLVGVYLAHQFALIKPLCQQERQACVGLPYIHILYGQFVYSRQCPYCTKEKVGRCPYFPLCWLAASQASNKFYKKKFTRG